VLGKRVLKKVFGNKRSQRIWSLGELLPRFEQVQVSVKINLHLSEPRRKFSQAPYSLGSLISKHFLQHPVP